jgi:hypothetical protein
MSSVAPAAGLILLVQEGYSRVEEAAALAALPDALRSCPRERFVIDLMGATERALAARDWHEAARIVADAYRGQVKPPLVARPDYSVAYFGSVPIPLAVQLGYLLSTWRVVHVFQHHHEKKEWAWPDAAAKAPGLEVSADGVPRDGSPADGDLVIRVSTSHLVDPMFTREVVGRPLAEVDIKTSVIHEDALASPRDVDAVADKFKATLDELHRLYPNAGTVHLFAACPVGLALRLGMKVSPTIHPAVQTYEFNSKSNPKYYPAVLLQSESEPRVVFTDDERVAAGAERTLWAEELARVQELASKQPESEPAGWLGDVLPPSARGAFTGAWATLPRLRNLVDLRNSRIDPAITEAPDGFYYSSDKRTWVLGDTLVIPIMRRIKDEEERRRAARLFLLHEGMHAHQGLTLGTSTDVGRFPKVLEEIDYQADVWAQLHEGRITAERAPESIEDAPFFARLLMRIAVETMLSFDDGPMASTVMQIRRVSRYLIWSWQYLRTERFAPGDNVGKVLADKPLIELAGPEIRARDNRVWYLLEPRHTHAPEIAVYHRNRLHRFGAGPASPHVEVLEALRTRDGERLRSALRGVFDLVVPRAE